MNCRREQIPHPDQVIGSGRESEDPSNVSAGIKEPQFARFCSRKVRRF
jgi:hypothetical protein